MNFTLKAAMLQYESWVEHRNATGGLSDSRLRVLRSFHRKMETYLFCGKPLGAYQASWLNDTRLQLLHEELAAAHASVTAAMIVCYLKNVLKRACRMGFVSSVPQFSPRPAAYREPKIPDKLAVERLLAVTGESLQPVDRDMHILIRFLLSTGARPSEAAKLDWRQFDTKNRCFTLHGKNTAKTGRLRRIYVGTDTLALLDRLGPRAGRVFYRWRSSHSIKRRFEDTCRRHGQAVIYPYSLRRMAITLACRAMSVSDVAKMVDSSPAVIAKHYDAAQVEYLKSLAGRMEQNF